MRVNEQGRSMIEMLGVLAIVGVLSVGGIAGYSKAMNKFKTNKAIDQVNMISTSIRTLYSSQKNYNGLNNKLAKKAGAIPAEMFSNASNSGIMNAFGGGAVVAAVNVNGVEDGFTIQIDKIPLASCVTIVTTDWGGDSGSGLAKMKIEGGTTKEVSEFPVTISDANIACSNSSTITWTYN